MDKQNITKEYTNDEITIIWKSAKCTHSGNCVKNNPEVFKPKQAPWILPNATSTDKIIEAIEKCPSRALTYYKNKNKR